MNSAVWIWLSKMSQGAWNEGVLLDAEMFVAGGL